MEINKYIGLFLLKHEYVFLPSIGSFYLVKKAASYIDENNELVPPVYTVEFKQGGGSIDDSFANFIATNERISIAHAANHLKSFCAEAKKTLQNGEAIILEGLGTLQGKNAGQTLEFTVEQNLEIKGKSIPFFKRNTGTSDAQTFQEMLDQSSIKEPKGYDEIVYKAPQVNWGKIATLVGILLIVLGGGFAVYYVMSNNDAAQQTDEQLISDAEQPVEQPVAQPVTVDSTATPDSAVNAQQASANNAISEGGAREFKMVINQYTDSVKAIARLNKLRSYGYQNVSYTTLPNGAYAIYLTVNTPVVDTNKVKDSLRVYFNPNGKVEILY